MIVDNVKISILWRNVESSYSFANKDVLDEETRTVGSSVGGVNKMLANSEEQEVLMQDILGLSPSHSDWGRALKNYWNSIAEDIPAGGKELEVGFIYDITSMDKLKYIEAVNKGLSKDKQLSTDEDLRDYFRTKLADIDKAFKGLIAKANKLPSPQKEKAITQAYEVKFDSVQQLEQNRYKLGTPIKTAEYMLFRYCWVYSQVANSIELSTKSPNIRFYLHSEADKQVAKERLHLAEKDRMTTYIDVIKSTTKVTNVLYALGRGDTVKGLDETDQFLLLEKVSKESPDKFTQVAKDKNLITRAMIEKYIAYSLLRRLDGSRVIVDASDPSITVGNNMSEAITFFTNKKNDEYVTEIGAKFKGLPK